MNDTQKRVYERHARSTAVCDENAADFPANTKRGQCYINMKAIRAEMEALDVARETNTRLHKQGTSSKKEERTSLRKLLIAISNTAEAIGRDFPEIKGSFKRPKANSNDQTLLATARAFAEAAVVFKAKFIEYDMPANFIERLNTNISSFEQAISRQNQGASARVAANAGFEDRRRRSEQEIDRLDVFVRNIYGDDPAKMAAWERARRLERPRRTRKNGDKTGGGTDASGGSQQK
jgi:hypothetical protein